MTSGSIHILSATFFVLIGANTALLFILEWLFININYSFSFIIIFQNVKVESKSNKDIYNVRKFKVKSHPKILSNVLSKVVKSKLSNYIQSKIASKNRV